MRKVKNHKFQLFTLAALTILFIYSCAVSQIELTSSWTNRNTTVKKSPLVMVMVMGKSVDNRKTVESDMVARLKKKGIKAVGSLEVFQPEVQKYDSAAMVSLLRQNKIDMLLINAIVSVTEKERYIPGESKEVQVSQNTTPYNSGYYNSVGYGSLIISSSGNYYGYYNNYEAMSEKRFIPGQTVIDVTVLIESRLFDVSKPELLWNGQSKTFTKEPSVDLVKEFSKNVIDDITKNKLLLK
jgi:hypothetical protein